MTKWNLELELDTVEVDDVVNMWISGTICNVDDGACVTKLPHEGETNEIAIKPGNLKLPCLKLGVNRMNVPGGGTLKAIADDEEAPLISLEWLQPASPSINLNKGILSFDCPCCRAIEPVLVACEVSLLTRQEHCPVCLETKECRVLECGHGVCHSCWKSCRRSAMYGSIQLEGLDMEEVKKERAERCRLFNKKRTRQGSALMGNPFAATFAEIVQQAHDSEQGLIRLKKELMVEHPALWACDDHEIDTIYVSMTISGLKVVLQVIEERMHEVQDTRNFELHGLSSRLCFLLAKSYVESKNYLAAAPWAELNVLHVKRSPTDNRRHLSMAHQFAALTQRCAGFLSKSLEYYDSSLVACNVGVLNGTVHEMAQWTGTSGKLTRGC